ncbi:MAG: hypothetical protein Phyf2KO_13280 [Phycisphaerales bacterium]
MKPINRVTAAAAFVVFMTGSAAIASNSGESYVQPEAAPSIHDSMEEMGDAFRTISRGYNKADKLDDVLEAIGTLQKNIVTAKSQVPDRLSELSGEELETALTDYRVRMAKLLDRTTELEVALLTGDDDLAHVILRDELYPMRDEGHDRFSD